MDIHRGSSAGRALGFDGGGAHLHVLGVFHRHQVRAGSHPGPAPAHGARVVARRGAERVGDARDVLVRFGGRVRVGAVVADGFNRRRHGWAISKRHSPREADVPAHGAATGAVRARCGDGRGRGTVPRGEMVRRERGGRDDNRGVVRRLPSRRRRNALLRARR